MCRKLAQCVTGRHVSLHIRWPNGLAQLPLLLQSEEMPRLSNPREVPVSWGVNLAPQPEHKGLHFTQMYLARNEVFHQN